MAALEFPCTDMLGCISLWFPTDKSYKSQKSENIPATQGPGEKESFLRFLI